MAPKIRSSVPRQPLRWLELGLVLVLCLAFAARAGADDLSDFEIARNAYEAQEYERAVAEFMLLVGTDPPRLQDRLLVLESRKYLGASLLFVRDPDGARTQFRRLLLEEPDYTLDPLAFPDAVVSTFNEVRDALRAEIEARQRIEREAKDRERRVAETRERERKKRIAELQALALSHEIVREHSRWVAAVPFGAGQFQNGHTALGLTFAITEGLAGISSVATYFAHQSLRDETPAPADVGAARRLEENLRTANYVSFAAFVGLAIVGVVDAQVRFKSKTIEPRKRELDPGLERWVDGELAKRGVLGLRF